MPQKALPENRFILCVLALFRFATSRTVPSTIGFTFFSKQQFNKQNAKNSSVSVFFQKPIHFLGFCFSEEMVRLDIGVNQGFSQCEDGSVCDRGQRLLEVCLPFSFPDQLQGRKLGTVGSFGINYRGDFSC